MESQDWAWNCRKNRTLLEYCAAEQELHRTLTVIKKKTKRNSIK
jgi:hypothetical protein